MTRAYEAIPLLTIGCVDDEGKARYPKMTVGKAIAGRAVFELQEDLHTTGFLLPQADGAFGENTQRAVRALQQAAGLESDGEVGPDTKTELLRRLAASQPNDKLYAFVRQAIEAQGFGFEVRPGWVNLLGIRGFWHGQSVPNDFNRYNDTIYAAWQGVDGKPAVDVFDGSCDPGRLDPQYQNAKGTAHLMEGQWWFQRGLHANTYEALRQARPVRVKRYLPTDVDRVAPTFDEGFFGINIHAGGSTLYVNNWSAGCQVITGQREGAQWQRFHALVYQTAAREQAVFPYTLVRSEALPAWS